MKESTLDKLKNLPLTFFIVFLFTFKIHSEWIQTNGPYDFLQVKSLSVTQGSVLAVVGNSILRLDSLSGSWVTSVKGINGYVNCIQINGNTVLTGTTTGLYISNDNGNSWTNVVSVPKSRDILQIAVKDNKVFIMTEYGVYVSSDNCESWVLSDSALEVAGNTFLSQHGDMVLLGTTDGGLFISQGDSATWFPIAELANKYLNCILCKDSTFIVGTKNGIYFSNNSGKKWKRVENVELNILFLSTYNSNIFAGTQRGTYVSTDNGVTWTLTNNIFCDLTISGIVVLDKHIIVSTYGCSGFFISSDGGKNWEAFNKGINYADVNCLNVIGKYLIAGTNYSIHTSSNYGKSWVRNSFGYSLENNASIVVKDNKVYIANLNYGSFISEDSCKSWKQATKGLETEQLRCITIEDSNLYLATEYGIYTSNANNIYWTHIDSNISNKTVFTISAFDSTLITGTWGGGIFRSTNFGKSWAPFNSGNIDNYIFSSAVTDSFFYIGHHGGILRALHNDSIWEHVLDLNIITHSIFSDSEKIVAATTGGVFFSVNNGKTWTSKNSGLKDSTGSKAIVIFDNKVFAGINNLKDRKFTGVWSRPLIELESSIERNFENKDIIYSTSDISSVCIFNGYIEINLRLKVTQSVNITIYNYLGQQIASTSRKVTNLGLNKLHLKTIGIANGTYILCLKSGVSTFHKIVSIFN